jgi:hypothetical protein
MSAKDSEQLPPVGSFPYYKKSVDLFTIWINALRSHSDAWNVAWGKLKNRSYGTTDFAESVVTGIETSIQYGEQLFFAVGGSSAPPWIAVPWPPAAEVEAKVRKTVDTTQALRISGPSKFGATKGEALVGHVRRLTDSSIAVSVDMKDGATEGDYIGFVFSDGYSEPLAIVIVSVPARPARAPAKKRGAKAHVRRR